jgi:hypothetical protein
MARISSFTRVLQNLGWSAFGIALTVVLPCLQGIAQKPAAPQKAATKTLAALPTKPAAGLTTEQHQKAEQSYMQQRLSFQPNVGQTDKRVQYLSQGEGYALFLTPTDAVLKLTTPPSRDLRGQVTPGQYATLEMVTVGGNTTATTAGLEPESSHTNYIIGNDPKNWHSNVANFARVKYAGIYPGIDLTYYGNHSQLEYDFVVAPGADPNAIKIAFKGMEKIHLDAQGALQIETAAGPVQLEQPVMYQENADGSREIVQGKYELAKNEVHFVAGSYDKSKPLVIDPILGFSTYLGGSGQENYATGHVGNLVSGVAVDSEGASYITGISTSVTDFPFVGQQDAVSPLVPNAIYGFVSKFDSLGALVYSTFLGGSDFYPYTSDAAVPGGIAVDSTFHAYITGYTTTANFPFAGVVYQNSPYVNGYTGVMGFLTKLDTSGGLNVGANAYSTYLYSDIDGGLNTTCGNLLDSSCYDVDNNVGGYTYPTAIAVDANNNAYITGAFDPYFAWAYSGLFGGNQLNNYMVSMNQTTLNEDFIQGSESCHTSSYCTTQYSIYDTAYSAGVVELDQYGQNILYFTYIGGTVNDVGTGVTVDSSGIYVTGYTDSKDFPTSTTLQPNPGSGTRQAFVAKFDPTQQGSAQLVYSTYLGGSGATINGVLTGDEAHAIAVDTAGSVYVTGSTASVDFPVNGLFPALQGTLSGGLGDMDAFVSKIDPTGNFLVFSTYLGGGGEDSGESIAVDTNGNFYVAGYSYSLLNNFVYPTFPTTTGALPVDPNLGSVLVSAGFVTEYEATPTSMVFSTLLASPTASGSMVGTGVAVDPAGNVFVTGETQANDMETTSGAYQTSLKGSSDAFLTKIWPILLTDSDNLNPVALNFGSVPQGTTSAWHTVTITNTGETVFYMTTPTLGGGFPGSYFESDNCPSQLSITQTCTMQVNFAPTNGGQFPATLSFNLTDGEALTRTIEIPINGTGSGLIVSPNPVLFSPTFVGTTSTYGIGVSIQDPTTAAVTINSLVFSNPAFAIGLNNSCTAGIVISNGGGCEFYPTFTPTTTSGLTTGTVTISYTIGGVTNNQTVNLSGQGIGLQLSPATVLFPNADVGGVPTFAYVLATNNTSSSITFTNWTIPTGSSFSTDANQNGCQIITPLAAGATCRFKIFFEPSSVNEFQSTFTVTYGPGVTQTVNLIGYGVVPNASIQPTGLSFPNTVVGYTSPMQQVLVTNTGGYQLTLAGFSIPANSGYSIAAAGTTCTTNAVLTAATNGVGGGFCYIGVVFDPTVAGQDNSTLTITDNSGGTAGATQTVSLGGFANAPFAQGTFAPTGLNFPGTEVGQTSPPQTMVFTNTGNIPLTNIVITASGQTSLLNEINNCPTTLDVNGICTFSYTFTPVNNKAVIAGLSISDNATSPQTAAITALGLWSPTAVISTSALNFPNTLVGVTSPSQSFTISDTGNGPLYLQNIYIPAGSGFAVSSTTCSFTQPLPPTTGICSVSVVFDPKQATSLSQATLTITDNSDNVSGATQTVVLSGQGLAPQAVLTPSTLTFTGTDVDSTSPPQTITLSNPGNSTLNIASFTYTGAGFQDVNNCGSTLAAGDQCTIVYTFAPTAAANVTGSLTVKDDAANSPQIATLYGYPASFTLAVSSPTLTIVGTQGTQILTVTPTGGFDSAITFGCTGLPVGATCTFSPETVTPTGGLPATTTITINTPLVAMNHQPGKSLPGKTLPAATLALALCLFGIRKRRKIFMMLLLLVSLVGIGTLSGCGGVNDGYFAHPPSTSTVTVTGTSGALSNTTNFTLTVE